MALLSDGIELKMNKGTPSGMPFFLATYLQVSFTTAFHQITAEVDFFQLHISVPGVAMLNPELSPSRRMKAAFVALKNNHISFGGRSQEKSQKSQEISKNPIR